MDYFVCGILVDVDQQHNYHEERREKRERDQGSDNSLPHGRLPSERGERYSLEAQAIAATNVPISRAAPRPACIALGVLGWLLQQPPKVPGRKAGDSYRSIQGVSLTMPRAVL
jgi:hypothetical protein